MFNLHGLKIAFVSFFLDRYRRIFDPYSDNQNIRAMPILTLLISLFFAVSEFDGRGVDRPTSNRSTTGDVPEYIIMDEEAP